jgi:hypothetical protein
MNKLRKNTGNFSLMVASKKIPRNKLNKGCKLHLQGELQTTQERNQGRLQKVERPPMFMGW